MITLDTKTAAIDYRDSTVELIDTVAMTAGINSYDALMALRAAVVIDINGRIAKLPEAKEVVKTHPVPNLVLSWSLYQSLDKDADLVSRNGIRNPVFVSGTVEYVA